MNEIQRNLFAQIENAEASLREVLERAKSVSEGEGLVDAVVECVAAAKDVDWYVTTLYYEVTRA